MPHPPVAPAAAAPPSVTQLNGIEMAAFVLAVLAILYVLIWWRDRGARFIWLAGSFMLIAAFFATDRLHMARDAYVDRTWWTVEIELALLLLTLGVVDCLNVPSPWRNRARLAFGLPYVVFTVLVMAGVPMLRKHHNFMIMFTHVGMAVLAFQAARREPGTGHALIALALLSIPGMSSVFMLTKVDPVALRYFVPMPLILLGVTLLTVTLERRGKVVQAEIKRRLQAEEELIALNASLERQVQERTADLRHVIAGLESFNRTVSHDLRGPLSGMASLADMAHTALLRQDDSVARRVLPAIAQQAQELAGLVQALLSLAQVSEVHFQAAPTSLSNVVQDALRQLSMTHPDWPVDAVRVHPLPTAQADAALLRPVFANLIGNALKFRRQDVAPSVDISARAEANEVVIQVRDNGRGFDAAQASSLFEPFVRLHQHDVAGHGVGLSIVRRAVERHGGRVWAEARPGEGASFYFTLPA